ncbi:MAG: outer membrane beta-barrel protein, partial [Polyangiales bacterium]
EGPGFKTGRFVLHPGLAIDGGYDNNVFLQETNKEDSFILRLTGYLDFATMSSQRQSEGESNVAKPQKITFRGGLGASYYHYFNDRVRDNVGVDAHVDFAYNPSRVFSLQIHDDYRRLVQPFSDPNTLTGETISYGRNLNNASIDFIGRSRSQVLEGRVGYTNSLEFFDSFLYAYANNMTHRVPAQLSWRFFPSSALVYEVEYAHQDFVNPELVASSPTELSDNNRVRNQIGYNGALTNTLSLTAFVGYAAGFYQTLQDFDDVTARFELRWAPRPSIKVDGGYTRDVLPSFIGNFTLMNRLHFNTTFIAAGALSVGLRAWVSFDKSGLALRPDGTPVGTELERKDIRTRIALWGEYRFRAWISIFAEVSYLADFTDFEFIGLAPLVDPTGSYQKVQAWIGLRIFY